MPVEYDDVDENDRLPCDICQRKFNPDAYEKHRKICKKVFATKRKAFNTQEQRIISNEHKQLLKKQVLNEKKKGTSVVRQVVKAKKWQKQSEEFRAAMKSGQKGNENMKMPTSTYDDYFHCQYCNRKYNETAYNKHLTFCMKKSKDSMMKPKLNTNSKPNLNVKFRK